MRPTDPGRGQEEGEIAIDPIPAQRMDSKGQGTTGNVHRFPGRSNPRESSLGWVTLAVVVTALYLACIVLATYPFVLHAGSSLPSPPSDPLMHLWEMRWYKSCLLEGELPFLCPRRPVPDRRPPGQLLPRCCCNRYFTWFYPIL